MIDKKMGISITEPVKIIPVDKHQLGILKPSNIKSLNRLTNNNSLTKLTNANISIERSTKVNRTKGIKIRYFMIPISREESIYKSFVKNLN